MLRNILGPVAGLSVAFLVITAAEWLGHTLFPIDRDSWSATTIEQYMAQVPLGAKLAVIVAWMFGALLGGLTASLVANRHEWPAWIVGGAVLVMTGINLALIPHPLWMAGSGVVLILAAAFAAGKIASRSRV